MSNYRYQIEQYHSIGKADIAINGITVLAGVNGAGKSTLARWLYYIVNISYIYDTNRFEEYQQNLGNEIRQYATAKKEFAESNDEIDVLSKAKKSILDIKYNGVETADEVLNIYMAATKQFCEELKKALPTMNQNALTRISNFLHIERKSNEPDGTLIERFMEERTNKGTSEKEAFLLALRKRSIDKFFEKTRKTYHETDRPNSISFQEDGVEIITDKKIGSLLGLDDAIYIDTPMALSVTDSTNLFWNELLFMLKNQEENIDISREAKKMLKRITLITGGEVVEKKDVFGQKELFYTRKSDNLTIKLENAATGIKTFAYIEQLLRKGYLTNRTVLIIDEPEAHLHPQWIVEFARLLVLLNKEIGLKIMIASHAPDMVSAIRYVSDAEGVIGNTNFYLAEKDADAETFTYKQLGKDIDPIFESFNKSFDLIEKYGIDNG
jgi:predicted ATPase